MQAMTDVGGRLRSVKLRYCLKVVRTTIGRIARSPLFFAVIAAVTFCAPPAIGQTLAPAAQAAMERGLASAQQQDYKLAYRYFLDAQKADPEASRIWFNLGLAAAKIPGHEFRAIAWFKAFLLANPTAGSAAAVRSQITQLEVEFEGRLLKVVDALEPVAKSIADKQNIVSADPFQDTPENRRKFRVSYYLRSGGLLAAMRLYLGDKAGAEKTRQKFSIEKGKMPHDVCDKASCFTSPTHLKRALASVGSYDEIEEFSNLKNADTGELIFQGGVTDRGLFAAERGDVDIALKLSNEREPFACKFYELGRIKDADVYVAEIERPAFEANNADWLPPNAPAGG